MNNFKQNAASGFALIEVLLAVVILAIGLLAGSKMQILGLNYTQGALTRSHATMAANDIIDRMRLNPEGIAAGTYDGATTSALPQDPNCISSANGCDAVQLAQHDIRMWSRYFGLNEGTTVLPPGASGTIEAPAANDKTYTIKIQWVDHVQDSSAEPLAAGATDPNQRTVSIGVILL